MVTRMWKVYGRNGKIRSSIGKTETVDFTPYRKEPRIMTVLREDITKTREYVIVIMCCTTAELCEAEFDAQLYDGLFEDDHFSNVVEL